ncbi:MAG: lipid-A-disaccharide synthase [Flavobacteriales bacterium]
MNYYVIAGEASGDLHGSNLIKALSKLDNKLEIRAWGGDLMEAAGAHIVKHYRDLAFMGFVEVLMNIRTIAKNLKFCKKDIADYKPDALILIDYPGFNLRMAKYAKSLGIPVHYYISPTVWAWKSSRVNQIKSDVDQLFCILPFEPEFYKTFGYETTYVGHPLLDSIDENELKSVKENQNTPYIALLPGSRVQEIKALLPVMVEVTKAFPEYEFKLAVAPSLSLDFIKSYTANTSITLVENATHQVLKHATLALVTSGTATLETALFNTPEIVCYKTSTISYWIGRMLVKVKYICLVNLIFDKEVVPELIQHQCTSKALIQHTKALLSGEKRKSMLADYKNLKHLLGQGGASKNVAKAIHQFHQN